MLERAGDRLKDFLAELGQLASFGIETD